MKKTMMVGVLAIGGAMIGCYPNVPEDESATPAAAPAPTPSPSSDKVSSETAEAPAANVSIKEFVDAAQQGDLPFIQRAIRQGIDVNGVVEDKRTALMLAAFEGRASVVQELLKQGAEVDLRDATQRTALMFASTGPDVATVEAILKAGADVNAKDSHENWTPLMFAAAEGHRAVVEKLLDYGARTDLRDTDGDGALEFAASNRHPEVVELLRARSNTGGNAKSTP